MFFTTELYEQNVQVTRTNQQLRRQLDRAKNDAMERRAMQPHRPMEEPKANLIDQGTETYVDRHEAADVEDPSAKLLKLWQEDQATRDLNKKVRIVSKEP